MIINYNNHLLHNTCCYCGTYNSVENIWCGECGKYIEISIEINDIKDE